MRAGLCGLVFLSAPFLTLGAILILVYSLRI